MGKSKEGVSALVRSINDGIKKYGLARIEQKLSELSTSSPKTRQALIKSRILDEISAVYGISKRAFLTSNKRGAVTQAKVTAILLFSRHLTASQAEIADIFDIPVTVCYARIRTFKRVVENRPVLEKEKHFEKVYQYNDFMAKIDQIDRVITEFVKAETEPLTDWRKW